MVWAIKNRKMRFHKDDEDRGTLYFIGHSDGRETDRALFIYSGNWEFRDIHAARMTVLQGQYCEDDGIFEERDRLEAWFKKSEGIVIAMNDADEVVSEIGGGIANYPVDVFPPAKKVRWFGEINGQTGETLRKDWLNRKPIN